MKYHGAKESIRLPTPGTSAQATYDDEAVGNSMKKLELASKAFNFPYKAAYAIQIDLMQAVFSAIEDGKIGVFESPTGTVRSYTLDKFRLICVCLGEVVEPYMCRVYVATNERGPEQVWGGAHL